MQANYTNALCHLNATPLSVAVLAPCAWSENLACGGAWQSTANSAKQAQQIQCGEYLQAEQRTAIRQIQLGKCGENGRCLRAKQAKRKWGSVWAGDFSLVACAIWHAFALNLQGFSHTHTLQNSLLKIQGIL